MKETINRKVNVWDTYVTKKDDNIMHFDILAPEEIAEKGYFIIEMEGCN